MTKRMLIDATHHEETRVVVMEGSRLVEFDYESQFRRQLKGNIFLAKVTRVEPSLQAAFVNFGGNRHGFLPFSEIHPDYYRIPVADREELLAQQRAMEEEEAAREAAEEAEEAAREVAEAARRAAGADGAPFSDADREAQTLESDAADNFYEASETRSIATPQGEEARELAAEEAGYVHDEIDLTPMDADDRARGDMVPNTDHAEDDGGDDGGMEDDFIGEDAILSAEVDGDREGDEDAESEGDGDSQEIGVDPSGEGASTDGTDENASTGRRSWRRGGRDRDRSRGNNGRNGRYMGARARRDERSEETGPAGLHARFRRRYKIQEVIKRGQIMLVQVAKEERGNKGAAVTTYLSLPGRYCVLMPNSPRGGGISRKIGNFSDRRRLKDMLRALEIPSGMSVILRTAGVERSEPEIKRDYDYLLRLWDNIRNMTLQSSAPALIYEEGDLIKRSIRDIYSQDVEEILISGENGYNEARDFMSVLMPGSEDRIEHYTHSKMPLFQRYQVESQITEIGEPIVQLKSGGYLVINQTEALVAVDVNSGRATKERHIEETALKTNLEAADEVARQLRLRDLGGLVVIDFIDMEDRRNNAKVERRLKDALASDRARIQLSRISTFGLLELSRQRLNPSLTEAQFQKCPHCHGFGFIRSVDSAAILALRALEEEGVRARATQITLHVPNEIALYILNSKRDMLAAIEKRYEFRVGIHVDESLAPSGYVVEPMKAAPTDDEDEGSEEGEVGAGDTAAPRKYRKKPVAMEEAMSERNIVSPTGTESNLGDEGSEEEDDSIGNKDIAEDTAHDENFNRTDIEPDGDRPRARRGGRGGQGRGNGGRSDRSDRNNRGDRAGRSDRGPRRFDQNAGNSERDGMDTPSGADSDRASRRDGGRGRNRPFRDRNDRPDRSDISDRPERFDRTDRPDRAERSTRPQGQESAPRGADVKASGGAAAAAAAEKPRATYFIAKRRSEETSQDNAAALDEATPRHEGDTNAPDAPKKKGWWNHFS